jgi:hypothetical protein
MYLVGMRERWTLSNNTAQGSSILTGVKPPVPPYPRSASTRDDGSIAGLSANPSNPIVDAMAGCPKLLTGSSPAPSVLES